MTDINIDYTAVKSSGKAVDSIIFSLSYKDEVSKMEVDKRNILKMC
jgi:plasmid replication initiation protein